MFIKVLYYYVILVFLIISPYTFSASLCENAFSRVLSFIRGEIKSTPQPPSPPPSTSILVELKQKYTQVYSSFSTYHVMKLEYGESRFLQREYVYEDFFEEANHSMQNIGDSYYWSRYVPKRAGEDAIDPSHSGQFIIGFAIRLASAYPDRVGYFYHRIHWDSDARNETLRQEKVREIFTKIYGTSPEIIAAEFQSEFIKGGNASREEVDKLIVPFLNEGEKAGQIKQIILKVLQRRG